MMYTIQYQLFACFQFCKHIFVTSPVLRLVYMFLHVCRCALKMNDGINPTLSSVKCRY